ncbi:4-hydroxy-tetrahydrodipicolinate reductase [Abyssisolibacter fermentans]|uniref:4-hydroxy-tetrahydrodipicolinate reductase n=1 Tax=Abyssisolibacter fermentans TaxID=1766203 RepID=UPI00083419D3|nr:4-hydroxy-tetrahydrodipicolinate reductase [Abyssisolibacter fermentans]
MIKVVLNGYMGKMCQVLIDEINNTDDMIITAGIDTKVSNKDEIRENSIPLYSNPYDIKEKADVIIDFSHPSCVKELVAYALYKNIPLVIATTGLSISSKNIIEEASKSIPIFISANMSIGVNLLLKLVNESAKLLNESFDIEIIEKHHNKKVDAPSGTAYMIADNINRTLNNTKNLVFLRHGNQSKRSSCEIGIHSIRCGTIVGEHSVIFAGNDEILEISHKALSKKIFANGALNAARFIIGKAPKVYNMNNMI